jgi:cyclopropane fatty-acyl-phospholipid synthase-like methyltransferase
VAGTARPDRYLDCGRRAAESLGALLASQGLEIARHSPVLEFGCGCGRVLMHMKAVPGLHGCDTNPELVAWCAASLPDAK